MTLPQQKYREIVFQLLYSHDLGIESDKDTVAFVMKELAVTRKSVFEALDRVHLIKEKLDLIDELIGKTSKDYAFDRIQVVERNILRLGVYEIIYDDKIPSKAAIAEAIRLARKFGTPEAASFVNAILDSIYKQSMGEQNDEAAIHESSEALQEIEEVSEQAAQEKSEGPQQLGDQL